MTNDLEDLFTLAKAQNADATLSDAVMARVLADAAREQQNRAHAPQPVPGRAGFWVGLAALFGGSGVLAGMASAAVAGLYLGFVQPPAFLQVTDAVIGNSSFASIELMPGVDALLAED